MDLFGPAAPEPGSSVADRYLLQELLGRGGMGRVYRARDTVLDRVVAVKLLDDSEQGDGGFGRAALTEARAAANLSHHGIARIFDSGIHAGRGFIVMELVEGRTLGETLDDAGRMSPELAATIAAQVADALGHAHRHGVFHCDVKPQNVILASDGLPKLIDFGIARAATVTGVVSQEEIVGSAPYIAPEQVQGERVDARTDVYALGAVLFEMLTGRPPFEGQTVAALITQRLMADPPSPRELAPEVSPRLAEVVLTALAREPAGRYPDASAIRDALRALADGGYRAEAGTAPIGAGAGTGSSAARTDPRQPWLHSRRGHAQMLAAAAIMLGLGAALISLAVPTNGTAALTNQLSTQPGPQPTPEPTVVPTLEPTAAPTATQPPPSTATQPPAPAADGAARQSTSPPSAPAEARPAAKPASKPTTKPAGEPRRKPVRDDDDD